MPSNAMSSSTIPSNAASLLARLCVALLFIPSGFAKIGGFTGLAGYIASKGVPLPELAAAIAIGAELGLGILVLIGFKTRWAALGLAVFVAVITPIFHNFWGVPVEQLMAQKQMFFKNVAILAGLLMLTAFGPGRWSLEGRRFSGLRTGLARSNQLQR
jgi:putative oxidoreductase